MLFKNTNEVTKWLRGIPCKKQEIKLKLDFYKELCMEFKDAKNMEKHVEYYKKEIDSLNASLCRLLADVEMLFDRLDDEERLVLTARYINFIRWDYIEFKVFFSRRQAIRVHNRGVEKLIGCTVG